MRCRSISLLGTVAMTALLCGSVWAAELPQSSACHTALASLEQAEDAIAAARAASSPGDAEPQQRSITARLLPLRQRVADACLGGLATSPPPSQHTWVLPPPAVRTPAPRVQPPATPPVTVQIPRVEPPVTINACNGATCIGSDGSMLTRVGPNLVGPRGACRAEGVFLRCP